MRKQQLKRNGRISLLLVIAMVITMLVPVSAFADDEGGVDNNSFDVMYADNDISMFAYNWGPIILSNDGFSMEYDVFYYDENGEEIYLNAGTDYTEDGYFKYDEETEKYIDLNGSDPSEAGEYYLVVNGIGAYTGTKEIYFTVDADNDISMFTYNCDPVMLSNDGFSLEYDVFYYDENGEEIYLIAGTDYTEDGYFKYDEETEEYIDLNGSDPSEAGKYYLLVNGIGAYTGTTEIHFTVYADNDISMFDHHCDDQVILSNDGFSMEYDVFYYDENGEEIYLNAGTDYTEDGYFKLDEETEEYIDLNGSDPSESGEYYLVVNGIGAYTGTKEIYFTVYADNDISSSAFSYYVRDVYGFGFHTPEIFVYRSNDDEISEDLIENQDYMLTGYVDEDWEPVESILESGCYGAIIDGINAYTGRRYVFFEYRDVSELEFCNYQCSAATFENGTLIKPEYSVFYSFVEDPGEDAKNYLTEDQDYQFVSYVDESGMEIDTPTQEGEYGIKLIGLNEFKGTKILWFNVYEENNIGNEQKFDISVSDVYVMDSATEPECTAREIDQKGETVRELKRGTDYEISYYLDDEEDGIPIEGAYPTESGEYVALIQGTGAYSGSRRAHFSIIDVYDIRQNSYVDAEERVYLGESGTIEAPKYTLTRRNDGEILSPEYYEFVAYWTEDGDGIGKRIDEIGNPGSYYIELKGKAPYYGSVYIWFYVERRPVDRGELVIDEPAEIETEEGADVLFGFTADTSGHYRFFSASEDGTDPDLIVYTDEKLTEIDTSDYNSGDFDVTIDLDAGQKVYLVIKMCEGTCTQIAVEKVDDESGQDEEDQAIADEVTRIIADLPILANLKIEDKAVVDAAREAFEALTEAQQAKVAKEIKDKLNAAVEKIEQLEKAVSGQDQGESNASDDGSDKGVSNALDNGSGKGSETGTVGKSVNADKTANDASKKYNDAVKKAKALKVKSPKAKAKAKKKAKVTWKAAAGASGYQIQYGLKKNFKKAKTVKVKGAKKKTATLKKLKAGKKYYVRIRPYSTVKNTSGKKEVVYGKWSKTMKIKAKK